jgi:hypothetical protein
MNEMENIIEMNTHVTELIQKFKQISNNITAFWKCVE